MARINQKGTQPRTHEGGRGYKRTPQTELFLLGATQFSGEKTFYENPGEREDRFVRLVRDVADEDPVWMLKFVTWLRGDANIRTASVVAGLEGAKAIVDDGGRLYRPRDNPDHDQSIERLLAKAGVLRPDEVGEATAYWLKTHGRAMPAAIKRALADRARELYTERSLLKYDTASHPVRFGDVIELVHPRPRDQRQSDLFRYAIERRHNRDLSDTVSGLEMVSRNLILRAEANRNPHLLLSPETLRQAGMTWEDALSLAGSKVSKKELWEALIPSMGYMALLRNLRNFDQAGVEEMALRVAEKLVDPDEVAWSRQLPMRFLSAYSNAGDRWHYALEAALYHSIRNVPFLSGRTLILVDTSTSMNSRFSDRGTLLRWDVASLFGIVLAQRCEHSDLVSYSTHARVFTLGDEGTLQAWHRWHTGFNLGGGTHTVQTARSQFANHDRVVILTDEQAHPDGYGHSVNTVLPAEVPVHTINVAGYRYGHTPELAPNRYTYTGLTDQHFKLIPLVEAGDRQQWPWQVRAEEPVEFGSGYDPTVG